MPAVTVDEKTASEPTMFVELLRAVTEGATPTVSVAAGELVAEPARFVTITVYEPASASWTLVITRWAEVAPEIVAPEPVGPLVSTVFPFSQM